MNYFQPYSLPADQSVLAAWDSQLAELGECPALVNALAKQRELFPRFAAYYARLRALPRGTRRALQRKLARACELVSVQPEWQWKLAGSLAGAALLLALAQSASAATITVTTNVPDINDGDGKCSLIEAIINANDDAATHPDCAAGSGADTIVLPKGSEHTLTSVYADYHGATGLPVITSSITIQGNTAKISRESGAPNFRLVAVGNSGDLTISDLTLAGGLGTQGGGIVNYGTASLSESVITSNQALYGGGILNARSAVLTIDRSTITANLSLHIPVSAGGGLNNRRGGTVTITNSTISQNTAGSGDTNNAFGGGIASSGYMNIENTTVSGNTAIADHDISRCTPSKSFCHQYIAWSAGGGIMNGFYATLVLLNSTISQNDAGSNSIGGGIFSGGPTGEALLIHTTVTGNHATTAGGGLEGSTFKLSRSLIAGNNCTYCAFFETAREAAIGNAQADDFNLFGHSDDSGISGFTPGKTDIVGRKELNKILGPLTNNGGPTLSHSLVKGSPAINAAPIDANCPTTDQRGMARPQGKGCDIGAVEWTGGSSSKKGR